MASKACTFSTLVRFLTRKPAFVGPALRPGCDASPWRLVARAMRTGLHSDCSVPRAVAQAVDGAMRPGLHGDCCEATPWRLAARAMRTGLHSDCSVPRAVAEAVVRAMRPRLHGDC